MTGTSLNLENLKPASQYIVSVQAENTAGSKSEVASLSFETSTGINFYIIFLIS